MIHYIITLALQCEEGDLRLIGSSAINQGTVEICMNETWGTICYSNWGQSEANVVCRQLGFSENGSHYNIAPVVMIIIHIPSLQLNHTCIWDLEVSRHTIAMSSVLVGNYGLSTASVTPTQASVSIRLVFSAILIFFVRVHACSNFDRNNNHNFYSLTNEISGDVRNVKFVHFKLATATSTL